MSLSTGHRSRGCAPDTLLRGREVFAWPSVTVYLDAVAGSLICIVGQNGDAETDAGGDNPVPASRGQIGSPAGQRRLDSHERAVRSRNDLQVHALPAVLARIIGAFVADPVAFGECPVEQDIAGVGGSQGRGQAQRPAGQKCHGRTDVGVAVPTLIPNPAAIR